MPKENLSLRGPMRGSPHLGPSVPQMDLFPKRAKIIHLPDRQTPHSKGSVITDDGMRYFIKGDAGDRNVRASEWIATHIAQEIGIDTPWPQQIEMPDKTILFGSKDVSSVSSRIVSANLLFSTTLQGNESSYFGKELTKTFVLDCFGNNHDRHPDNYLIVHNGDKHTIYAYDFSCGWVACWPPTTFPEYKAPPPFRNTRVWGRLLFSQHGFQPDAAEETLRRIDAISPDLLRSIMSGMPPDWLAPNAFQKILDWWSGPQKANRISAIRDGLKNGWLL